MRTTCKNPDCGKRFIAERAGALYCSGACRTAACRKRAKPPPSPWWYERGDLRLSSAPRENALSNDELAERLLEIAAQGDGGAPKTARRFYYLALSHGYIRPDMGAHDAAKKSRNAAYNRVLRLLGTLRKMGRLGWDDVLDLTRELDEWRMFASPREARAQARANYDEDRWLEQPAFPILIVEKDTLQPVCRPFASRWRMPFASSRGYSSLTLQHDVAKLLLRRRARTGQRTSSTSFPITIHRASICNGRGRRRWTISARRSARWCASP